MMVSRTGDNQVTTENVEQQSDHPGTRGRKQRVTPDRTRPH